MLKNCWGNLSVNALRGAEWGVALAIHTKLANGWCSPHDNIFYYIKFSGKCIPMVGN